MNNVDLSVALFENNKQLKIISAVNTHYVVQ